MQTLTKDAKGFIEGVVSYLSNEKNEPAVMPRVATLASKVSAQAKKEQFAKVYSVVSLTSDEKKHIAQMLTKLLGHGVEIETVIDSHLVGGLRIQVADWMLDTSIDRQLQEMVSSFRY